MKPDPDLFDRIRVKPRDEAAMRRAGPRCDAVGCERDGTHRAPKGRQHEGEYHSFCIEHVRLYNQSYNYFTGMSDVDVETYIKSAMTGHRPTWSVSANAWSRGEPRAGRAKPGAGAHFGTFRFDDPLGAFADEPKAPPREEARPVRNVERRALATLNLDITATGTEIKTRFKELVKRHHPDANGGDRACEDKLREVIEAYNHLKKAGLCD